MNFKIDNKTGSISPLDKKQDKWDVKDNNIQIAQSVNLAVQELSAFADKMDVVGFPEATIKSFARKHYKILTELKEELK